MLSAALAAVFTAPMVCPECNREAQSLEPSRKRSAKLPITREMLRSMLGIKDARIAKIVYDHESETLDLYLEQIGPNPEVWFQPIELFERPEGGEYAHVRINA